MINIETLIKKSILSNDVENTSGLINENNLKIFEQGVADSRHSNILHVTFRVRTTNGKYEIPFLVSMGRSFFLTVGLMVVIGLAGPKINSKAFVLDKSMFKLKPSTNVLITMIVLILIALYAKFW